MVVIVRSWGPSQIICGVSRWVYKINSIKNILKYDEFLISNIDFTGFMSGLDWHVLKDWTRPQIHLHLLVISIFIQAFGAICTKYAADWSHSDLVLGIRVDLIIYVIILVTMGLQVVIWQYALKYYSLSFAYPFRSLVSFVVLFSAVLLFDETITVMNILGLAVITIGVFYLARDKEILS